MYEAKSPQQSPHQPNINNGTNEETSDSGSEIDMQPPYTSSPGLLNNNSNTHNEVESQRNQDENNHDNHEMSPPSQALMSIPTPVENSSSVTNGGSSSTTSCGNSSKPSGSSSTVTLGLKMSSLNDMESGSAKSIPVHCIVEHQVTSSQELQVDIDTYAILPASTLFCELVRSTLVKIGYSPTEALGAKGAIQIKRWKPLTFDTITDDPDATLEDILGELSSIATLRIRLCSQLQLFAMEDIKEKLLQFLLQHSQGILTSAGCPIDKNLLIKIAQGECPKSLPEDTQEAFTIWFRDQVQKGFVKSTTTATSKPNDTNSDAQSELTSSSPDQVHQMSPNLPQGTGMPHFLNEPTITTTNGTKPYPGFVHVRPRARTSFDPEHEVPRLQKWFEQNQHPSREQMCAYMNELNIQPSRQGRRPLDLTNIVYWFKNARAANRRAIMANKGVDLSGYLDSSFGESSNGDDNDCFDEREMNTSSPGSTESRNENEDRHVPELPNPFAVYVVKPIHHSSSVNGSPEKVEVLDYEKEENNKPHDFSVPKTNGDAGTIHQRSAHQYHSSTGSMSSSEGGEINNKYQSGNSNKENERYSSLHHHNHNHSNHQQEDEQATDLSLPKKRKMSFEGSNGLINGYSERANKMSRLMKEEPSMRYPSSHPNVDDDEDYGCSSNTSSPSPSPKSLNSSTSSSLNTSQHHLGFHSMTQQALQMAAMSHALNMHYMHPAAAAAAMYPLVPPAVSTAGFHHNNNSINNTTSPRPTPSPGSNSLNSSSHGSDDRKKRSRVFIDPLTEIPKLEKWFLEDTHPSSYMIEKYTEELNMQPYRQRFPCLEAKNVQLWFKNHRAKVKRARQEQAALCQINHVNAIPT